jgi:hypothetical protein
MKSEWFLISALCFYIVVFIACLVSGIIDLRKKRKLTAKKLCRNAFDIEKFCADIPHDDRIRDPYVLIGGRWIRQHDPPPE